ncbi:GNAT family N-acetyltransferase [Oscillospiraceae bacterium MB08-C2-2]|nr:GNAT family N-acetyltransferase [Oscillospiraceae bacterium MB08-C2-2]
MIRFFLPGEGMEALLEKGCSFDPAVGSKILTLLKAYGGNGPLYKAYVLQGADGTPTGALGIFEGGGNLSAGPALDYDELAEFAQMSGLRFVFGSLHTACALETRMGGELFTSPAMAYRGGMTGANTRGIDFAPALRDVYRIIRDANPHFAEHNPFDLWLSYTTRLVRSGQAVCCTLNKGHIPVATGGIYSTGVGVGVIASIATLPGSQGKGYGRIITQCLVDRLLERGLTPTLFCREESLSTYYGRMGFVETGNWGHQHFEKA